MLTFWSVPGSILECFLIFVRVVGGSISDHLGTILADLWVGPVGRSRLVGWSPGINRVGSPVYRYHPNGITRMGRAGQAGQLIMREAPFGAKRPKPHKRPAPAPAQSAGAGAGRQRSTRIGHGRPWRAVAVRRRAVALSHQFGTLHHPHGPGRPLNTPRSLAWAQTDPKINPETSTPT